MRLKKITALSTSALLALGLGVVGVTLAAPAGATQPAPTPTSTACVPQDAIPEVPEEFTYEYQRYSWTGGPTEDAPTEIPPSDNWQANTTNYDAAGHGTDPIGVAFQMDNPGQGNGDWFFWTKTKVITQEYVPGVPAVECPGDPEPPCITVVWEMPSWVGPRTPTWSQDIVDDYPTECYNLDVPIPPDCGTQYQVDSYLNNEITKALIAGGFLNGPNNPRESFPPNAGWDKTYKLVQNPACPPEPETKVEYGDWVTGEYDCDDTQVTVTRTVATTTYTLIDNTWVGNTVVTEESRIRDLTAEELEDLVCPGPQPDDKVVTSEWVDGEYDCNDTTVTQTRTISTTEYVLEGETWVEGKTVIVTEEQVRKLTAQELADNACLAQTGGQDLTGVALAGFLALLLGAGVLGTRALIRNKA